jgi:hypothetical protein
MIFNSFFVQDQPVRAVHVFNNVVGWVIFIVGYAIARAMADAFPNTSLHQNACASVFISTFDVGVRVIANHVEIRNFKTLSVCESTETIFCEIEGVLLRLSEFD